jgi:formate dehydrogenase (coenzyme F420) beta subunit
MNTTTAQMKETISRLFRDGKIDCLIGYEKGTLPLTTRPCFIKAADEIDRLVWSSFCTNNLAAYLPAMFAKKLNDKKQPVAQPRIGIVAKGCDARSVTLLVSEHKVPEDKIVIIGMPCEGVADRKKVEKKLGSAKAIDWTETDESLRITTATGETIEVKKAEVAAEACNECAYPAAESADIRIQGKSKTRAQKDHPRLADFANKTPEQRWKLFTDEISRCIRCNACRQACPNCYCPVCFADSAKPGWVGASDRLSNIMTYHIGRVFHQAGRCVECDACARACPMGIDLRLFTNILAREAERLFEFVPGLSKISDPLLSVYSEKDEDSFITEA